MGQGIDTWASLRAACEEYDVPMNIPALVNAVAERARSEALQVPVHAVFTHPPSRAQDSVCEHNAPGIWSTDWDKVTCERCIAIARERGARV